MYIITLGRWGCVSAWNLPPPGRFNMFHMMINPS